MMKYNIGKKIICQLPKERPLLFLISVSVGEILIEELVFNTDLEEVVRCGWKSTKPVEKNAATRMTRDK